MSDAPLIKRIAAARVFVANMDKAVRFYRDSLGLSLSGQTSGTAVFNLKGLDFIVELADPTDPEGAAMIGRFTALSFEVADCKAACGVLTGKSVQLLGPAQTQAWGGTLAHFLDPDGNVLTLVEYPLGNPG